MFTIFLLQFFPFVLIPTLPPYVNPPPMYQQGFPPRPTVQNPQAKIYYRADHGNDYSNNRPPSPTIQGNPYSQPPISFPGTSLLFPSSSGSPVGGRLVMNGDQCVTEQGVSGTCLQKFQCTTFTQYSSIHAARITRCGQRGQSTLICCPGGIASTSKTQENQNQNRTPDPKGQQKELSNSNLIMETPSPLKEPTPLSSEFETQKPSISNQKNFTSDPFDFSSSPTVNPIPQSTDLETACTTNCTDEPFDFNSEDGQKVCGLFDSTRQSSWPWIVSIGSKRNNNTIDFYCLGSLVTTEYVISTAECLEGSASVIAFGAFIGEISTDELKRQNIALRHIVESIPYEKYINTRPGYKNIGLVRMSEKIKVTSQVSPVCFPFLAGVLDIIDFSGQTASTLTSRNSGSSTMLEDFNIQEYRIIKNKVCGAVVKRDTSKTLKLKIPNGLKPDNMCGVSTRKPLFCPIAGSPLVIKDSSSNSHVIIGLQDADPTCNELTTKNGKILIFTRINSYSSWVRDHVGVFPIPPPCYV